MKARLTLFAILLTTLLGCGQQNKFPQATDAAPDTVNYHWLIQNFGFVSDESPEVRAEKMLQTYLETFPLYEGEDIGDLVWHPSDGRGREDTLWVRKEKSDRYVGVTQTSRPDFSHRTAEAPDTAEVRIFQPLLFDSIDSPDITERGIRLWQRFVRVRQMLGMLAPDQLVWQPLDGDDADTLWVRHNTWVFAAVSPRHAVSKDSISTAQDFLALFGATTPTDSVVIPEKTFRERITYPRGALRPVGYVALSGIIVVVLLVVVLLIIGVRRLRRARQRKRIEKMRTTTAHALQQSDIVVRLKELAASGAVATAADWQSLVAAVDTERPLYVPTLRKHCAELSDRELHVCLLVFIGLQPTEMANLLGCTKQAVANIRTRLYQKLFGEKGTARQFDERVRGLADLA